MFSGGVSPAPTSSRLCKHKGCVVVVTPGLLLGGEGFGRKECPLITPRELPKSSVEFLSPVHSF